MGGMGFIENNKAACMLSVLTSTHLLVAARDAGVERFFYASSACVYAAEHQTRPDVTALREEDAYPAMPEDGYGWEKLFSERMARHFLEDFGLETRVARYHNVYGPHGTYAGGREKAPAAICRKVIEAKLSGSGAIEIWGDGEQTRSFMYVDDCVYGTQLLTDSDVSRAAEHRQRSARHHQPTRRHRRRDRRRVTSSAATTCRRPKGVRGRNSDNTLIAARLGWAPSITPRGRPGADLRLDPRPARHHGGRLTMSGPRRTGASP